MTTVAGGDGLGGALAAVSLHSLYQPVPDAVTVAPDAPWVGDTVKVGETQAAEAGDANEKTRASDVIVTNARSRRSVMRRSIHPTNSKRQHLLHVVAPDGAAVSASGGYLIIRNGTYSQFTVDGTCCSAAAIASSWLS